jgi:hypothetical protein
MSALIHEMNMDHGVQVSGVVVHKPFKNYLKQLYSKQLRARGYVLTSTGTIKNPG